VVRPGGLFFSVDLMRSFFLLLSSPFFFLTGIQAAAPQSPFISQLISSAEAKIKTAPDNPDAYSDLAFGFARRARETEDPVYWSRAEQAIAKCLKLKPGYFEARKTRVLLRLQQGRFADAEEEGKALNKQTPDDNPLYGFLADAALSQGKYPEAEALTQRMLDLRQVNGPGLERAARVRESIGFPDGAAEFWNSALRLASSSDTEERAYILTELAGMSRRRARFSEASRYASDALALEPDYPAALIEQARIALENKKPELAIVALTARLAQGDSFVAQYWLSVALQAAGRAAEANAAGQKFLHTLAASQSYRSRNELLARYYTSHGEAAKAVDLLKADAAKGLDQQAADAYAMALLESGNSAQAEKEIARALQPGVLNPLLFLHAAKIAKKNNDVSGAKSYLKKCIEANASSEYAETALQELQSTREAPPR